MVLSPGNSMWGMYTYLRHSGPGLEAFWGQLTFLREKCFRYICGVRQKPERPFMSCPLVQALSGLFSLLAAEIALRICLTGVERLWTGSELAIQSLSIVFPHL